MAQIYPIWDEDTDEERVAVSASFADPYLAVLRDDSSLLLLQADDSGDLDEISLSNEMSTLKWHSGCLYHDRHQKFSPHTTTNGTATANVIMFLLNPDYKLSVSCSGQTTMSRALTTHMQIFSLPDMKLLSVIEGVDCLQPALSGEPPRRSKTREPLKEVLVADLGDRWTTSPYLIVRSPAFHNLT